MVFWNELELKIALKKISAEFGKSGDLEIDKGHSFQYSISVFFPTEFVKQTNLMQFAPYDVVQQVFSETSDPAALLKSSSKFTTVKERNQQQRSKRERHEAELTEQVEKSIFGELNNGQEERFPLIRLKKSIDWIELISFQPDLDAEQKYQASLLSCEKNDIDQCLKGMMGLVDVQDAASTTVMLETLAKMHSEKVRTGKCVINFDEKEEVMDLTFFSEDEITLLNLFQNCMKTRSDFDARA